jgi:hypothetical protein
LHTPSERDGGVYHFFSPYSHRQNQRRR